MNLNNLSTNYKIILGISSVTLLSLIYYYIKNIFYPQKQNLKNINVPNNDLLIEGSEYNNNNIVEELKRITSTMFLHIDTLKDLLNTSREHYDYVNKVNKQKSVPTDKIKTKFHLSISDDNNSDGNSFSFNLSNFYKGRSFRNITNIKLLEVNIPYVPHNIWKGENNLHNKINYEIDNVNYHIETVNEEWAILWIYKDVLYRNIIKDMPNNPQTPYEHYVLGKIFGYGESEILEFIKSKEGEKYES